MLEEKEKEKEKENEDETETSTRIITQITLDCLLNKEQYSKYLKATLQKTTESSKKDRKFYKRRILQLTKDMLLSDEIDATSDMLFAFDNFARTCISYFKMIDKTDILQTDYPNMLIDSNIVAPDVPEMTLEESTKSLMRTVKINKITMDQFVKRISTVPDNPPIVPLKRSVNLKDPELRNKGIRKKKSIETVYENNTAEETFFAENKTP
jgi:hypothetical protein